MGTFYRFRACLNSKKGLPIGVMNKEANEMNCQETQSLIDDYLDGLLNPNQAKSLMAHCEQCGDCADSLAHAQQFRELLKNASVPPPSTGFVERALQQAVHQGAQKAGQTAAQESAHKAGPTHHDSHRQGFIKGFGSAIAAGLALWVVVSLFPSQQSTTQPQTSTENTARHSQNENTISIALQESTSIKLAFHTAQAVQGATITISLSDNLELVGYQNRQTLEWKTDLVAGDNVLTLPVKALNPQQGKIVAQVSHNKFMKSIELNLNVRNNSDAKKPVSKNHIATTPIA